MSALRPDRSRRPLVHGALRSACLCAALLGCDLPAAPAGPSSANPAGETARNGLESIESEEDARQIYYQYVDERGAVRFVATLALVPPEWRDRVGFVEMSSPPPMSPADAQRIRDARTKHLTRATPLDPTRAEPERRRSGDVIIYSADWCGACRRAKRFMDERGIDYEERNVDEPRWKQEMVAKAGPGGIPVFDVDGQMLRGFSPERLEALLQG